MTKSCVLLLFLLSLICLDAVAFTVADCFPKPRLFSRRVGMDVFQDTVTGNGIVFAPVMVGARHVSVESEVTDLHNNPIRLYGNSYASFPGWGLAIRDAEGRECRVSVRLGETESTAAGTESAVILTVLSPGTSDPVTLRVPGFLSSPGHRERIRLRRDADGWTAAVVSDRIRDFGRLPLPDDFSLDSIGVFVNPGGCVRLESLRVSPEACSDDLLTPFSDLRRLDSLIQRSADPLTGYWHLYDYTLEQTLLRTGGDYHLAIVPDGKGYLIIYLDGAKVGDNEWKCGMIKGELRPTSFGGIWDVTWIDASMKPMFNGLKAVSSESGTVLTIEFPAQESRLRLRRTF